MEMYGLGAIEKTTNGLKHESLNKNVNHDYDNWNLWYHRRLPLRKQRRTQDMDHEATDQ